MTSLVGSQSYRVCLAINSHNSLLGIQEEMMADDVGGGPQILEALLKTDSASSWNQDKLADFGKKTRKEARQLVKGGGGGATGDGDEMDGMDVDEVKHQCCVRMALKASGNDFMNANLS